jgi:hypothetical protein
VAATAKQFYEFWNIGDEQSLKQAIASPITPFPRPAANDHQLIHSKRSP